MKFVLRCLAAPRVDYSLIGLYRFLRIVHFQIPTLSEHQNEMLRLLIRECAFPLSKEIFQRYMKLIPTIVKIEDAFFITHDFEDLYHAQLFYEKKTLAFILENFRNGNVFVDVGANIGGYTIRLGKRGTTYAFEPNPRNYQVLVANVNLNGVRSAHIFSTLVGNQSRRANLYLSKFHGRHSMLGRGEYTDVKTVTLDSALGTLNRIHILKIDVEGAEPTVLSGAEETLKRTVCVVVETSGSQEKHTTMFLTSRGFEFVKRCEANSIFINTDLLGEQEIGSAQNPTVVSNEICSPVTRALF